jgi:hypothetical protein
MRKSLLLLLFVAGCQTANGNPPAASSMSDAELFGKARSAMLARLRDPESAKFTELQRVPTDHGEYVCGRVIAKNGFGGYSRASKFSVAPDGDVAVAGESLQLGIWASPCWAALPATQGDYDEGIRHLAGEGRRGSVNDRILN